MFNLVARSAGLLALALAAQAGAAQAALGPDAPSCRSGGPAILVQVEGLKARTGNIRVNVYGSDPSRFLERGQYVRQINLPATRSGAMPICVAVPRSGRYAVAVRHDVDGDGNDWGDGGGFSRNPDLSLSSLKPRYDAVAFNVGRGVQPVRVVLNYRFGLSIRPVRS